MAKKPGLRAQRHQWLVHLVLIVLSAVFLFPLLWLVSTALKPIEETMREPPTLIPSVIQWHNFRDAFVYGADKLGYIPFLVYGRNTLILCILGVSGVVVSNAVVAYAFARLRWPGRDILFAATLATMMVPFPVLMVPMYSFWRSLGWIGTFKPLWVPAWFGSAFNIFLLRQFFRTIPFELSEAARIDGCSEWGIFREIVLPLARRSPVPLHVHVARLSGPADLPDGPEDVHPLARPAVLSESARRHAVAPPHGGIHHRRGAGHHSFLLHSETVHTGHRGNGHQGLSRPSPPPTPSGRHPARGGARGA